MATLEDDVLSSLRGFLAQAEETPYLTINSNSLVFEGGDVLIITGNSGSDVFLVHREVLSKSPYFKALLSESRNEPKVYTINGAQRKVWVLELYFDLETNLPGLINKERSSCSMKRLALLDLTGRGSERWNAANTDDDYKALLSSTTFEWFGLPPRLQFLWSEPQPLRYVRARYVAANDLNQATTFPASSLMHEYDSDTYATFLNAYEEEIPLLDDQIYPRRDKNSLRQIDYSHEATVQMARGTLSILLHLLYGKSVKLPAFSYGAHAGWLCAHVIMQARRYMVLDLIKKDLEHALISQLKGRIWKAIYYNPRFYLMLGYRPSSVTIYIEAVKHIIGPSTRFANLGNSSWLDRATTVEFHNWAVPTDFQEDNFPREVIQFLIEMRYEMSQAAMKTPDELESYLRKYEYASELAHPRDLIDALRYYIKDKTSFNSNGDGFKQSLEDSECCFRCKNALKKNSKATYNILCSKHQHRARFPDVPYSTHLHTWGDMALAGHKPAWDWPPLPSEYRPFDHDRIIEETVTKPVTLEEVLELGLKDTFTIHLSKEDWDLHLRRTEQQRLYNLRWTQPGWRY